MANRLLVWGLVLLAAATVPPAAATPDAQDASAVAHVTARTPATGSKIWIGREGEFEQYLASAPIERLANVPVGVTRPRRAFFAGPGLAGSAIFKPIEPGRQRGFFESYKAEIAAYELDKLLGLGMVPPTIERRIRGDRGSLQLWVDGVVWLKEREGTTAPDVPAWNRQVYRHRVWDNLTGNVDRNQGNLLVDDEWNLILIDHSRAFTTTPKMPFKLTRIDRELYGKLKALTEDDLRPLSKWLADGPRPLLWRRDAIVKEFERLIAASGEHAVLVP